MLERLNNPQESYNDKLSAGLNGARATSRDEGDILGSGPANEAGFRPEIQRLVQALSPDRVLRRDALMRETGTRYWHEAKFDRALQAAVDAHTIEELPQGFFRLPYPHDENSRSDGASAP